MSASVTHAETPGSQLAYITNINDNTVSVIDTSTNTVTATVPVGSGPSGVAVNLAGTKVYVTNSNSNSVSVIDTSTNTVTATVSVGSGPVGVAVTPDGTKVYVANQFSNTVSVIDTSTDTVTATVPVGVTPYGVAVNPAGTKVYVASQSSKSIYVIDTSTNTVTATVSVGNSPCGVAVNQAGTKVYVTNSNSNSVSVIDTTTNTVTATVSVELNPQGVAVNPTGTKAYVANQESDTVSVIDTSTNTVIASVPVGLNPYGVAVNLAGTKVYVANSGDDTVYGIDTTTNTVTSTVSAGSGPIAFGQFMIPSLASEPVLPFANFSSNVTSGSAPLSVQFTDSSLNANGWNWNFGDGFNSTEPNPKHTYSSAGNYTVNLTAINGNGTNSTFATITVSSPPSGPNKQFAYITNYDNNSVSIIDTSTNTIIASVPVGLGPQGVAVNLAGTRAYVTNMFSDTVSVIDTSTNTVTATVPVESGPVGVAVTPDGTKAYVANMYSDSVSVIDTTTNTVTATVSVGFTPFGVAVDPAGTNVYVASQNSKRIYVIDTSTNTVTTTVSVGTLPTGVTVNPTGTKVYVTDYNENRVSVIDTSTNTVTASVTVGSAPQGVAVNPDGTKAYVANQKSNSVSVIDTSTNTVIASVTVGSNPYGVVVNPDGTKVYVANQGSNTVSVINTTTNTVTATVSAGLGPIAFGQFMIPSLASEPVLPVANFSSNVSSGSAPLSVQFTDSSENATAWNWDFGDGFDSTEQNPVHTYSIAGNYTVNLTASNLNGTDSKLATITVSEEPVLPVANFSSNVTSGYAPLSVQFTDLSENTTLWNWDFGDGFDSTEQNPVHTYSIAGNYTVNLTASNLNGTDSKLATITVSEEPVLPVANFSSNVTSGYVPFSVQFTDNSLNATGWNWDFGDGSNSTEQNPVHTYSTAGNYTVNLTASNGNGTNSAFATITVSEEPILPVANFSSNVTSGYVPLSVQFTDSSENATAWNWDFGDGFNSTEQNPVHTYSIAGNYTVNLTASNLNGTDSKLATITVSAQTVLPVANFSSNVSSGSAPLSVQFTDSSLNATVWNWDFGDGFDSTEQNPAHTYSVAGNYTVNLTVSNLNGTDSKLATITISEEPVLPVANFSSNVTSGYAPLSVQFTDLSENTTLWNWNFGDGFDSTEQNPVHTYSIAGNYTVNLTASNLNGTDSKLATITVSEEPVLPVANFSSNVSSGSAPLSVQFTDSSLNATAWNWDFGDGFDSTEQNPVHTYSAAGNYTVNLTASNGNGTNYTSVSINVIEPVLPYHFVTTWGSSGSSNGSFNYPYGVSVDSSGNVYVADTGNNRIQKFDSSGNFITTWGSSGSGNGNFSRPRDVAVDAFGNVYVADTDNNRIQKFDSSGNFISTWGSFGSGNGSFNIPYGVSVDSSGNVYVADTGNSRIQKFDSSGNFITAWGSYGSNNGSFIYPSGVSVDQSGNVYVSDTYNNRIQKFDSSGNFISTWGSSGSGNGSFNTPYGISVDSSGNVYVADTFNHRVQKFDNNGNFLITWGSPGSDNGSFIYPYDVSADSSDTVYVADTDNHRIQKFSTLVLPVANFSSNVSSGSAPLSVQFTDSSLNATEWNWDFGDGFNSTEQNPVHTYSVAGNYTVNLTVSNLNGTDSKLATITVSEEPVLPVANFSSNVTSGSAPLSVQFNDNSKNATVWSWDFGDGFNSTEQNPSHTYSVAGNYTVNLTVSNLNGTDSKLATITVSEEPVLPVANFSSNVNSGSAPLSVQFTDSSLNATGWNWNFGDGFNSTEQNPAHTYSVAGNYTVNLTVSNLNGTDSKLATITVSEEPVLPVANFSSNVSNGSAPLSVQFTDLSENTTGLNWDFGDGFNSTEQNPVHTYSIAGNYTVNLTVSNLNGTDSKLVNITVSEEPVLPVANFSSNVSSGSAPLSVQFTDSSLNATAWNWDFGDGFDSTEQNPVHTYSAAGNYTVNLTVSNGNGTNSAFATITVSEEPVLPVANFSSNVSSGSAPLSVQFTDSSLNATGWNWDFGDGFDSTEQNPAHTYSVAGNYTVNLTAINGNGTNSTFATITVSSPPSGPNKQFAYITNYDNNSVSIIDTSTNTVTATVSVGSGSNPYGVAVNPAGTKVYVANGNINSVSVIDTATNTVTSTVPVGSNPYGVAVTNDGTKVYVANGNNVSVIDTSTNTVTASVTVGFSPQGVAVSPTGTKAYVTDMFSDNVSVIDTSTNTVTAYVTVGSAPQGVAVNPTGTKAYVANQESNNVSVIDTSTNTVTATVPVGSVPYGVAVNPTGTRAYVANYFSNSVSVIDTSTNTVTATVPVGNNPIGVSVNPAGTRAYVANSGSSNVSVIDTSTNAVTSTVPVGSGPIAFGQFICSVPVQEPVLPVANFSSNVSSGSAPLSVQFTDSSLNATGWNWDFGDGFNSTEQNPSHVYVSSGSYTVNLTVTNTAGTNTSSRTGYILVSAPVPTAAFNGTPTSGTVPMNVTFTDLSTGSPTGWAWFFGDEPYTQTWTQMNASSGWPARVCYSSVALPDGSIVLMGGLDENNKLNDVWRSTDKGATWTKVSNAGWSARVHHSSVVLPDGSIVLMGGFDDETWRNDTWRSTDKGITWTLVNASSGWTGRWSHSSVALPDGSIVLIGGSDDATWRNDTWRSEDKGATWERMNESAGWTGRIFHSSVALPDGSIILTGGLDGTARLNDTWMSEDNGATWTLMNRSSGWMGRTSHSSVAMPDGSVLLMGGLGIDNTLLHDIWRSTDKGRTWTKVADAGWSGRYYHNVVALPDGSIVLMGGLDDTNFLNDTWWFQPAGSTDRNPTHTYTSAGNYTVILKVSNAAGYNALSRAGYVLALPVPVLPVANFSANVTSGNAPFSVQFTDSSLNATGWNWDFGDGFNSTGQNPKHTYSAAGNYTVNLTASNGNGTNSTFATITVLEYNPAYSIDKIVTDVSGNGSSANVTKAGDVISYQININNTGNIDLTNVTVTDPLVGNLTGPSGDDSQTGILNVGESWIYTGTYTVTQADLNSNGDGNGLLNNTATFDCDELDLESDTVTVPIKQISACDINKMVIDVAGNGPEGNISSAGEVVQFQVNVTNTGNVDLTNISVHDSLVNLTGPYEEMNLYGLSQSMQTFQALQDADGVLVVGETWIYLGNYTVTQADMNNNGEGDGFLNSTVTFDSDQTEPINDSTIIYGNESGNETGNESIGIHIERNPASCIYKSVIEVDNGGDCIVDDAGDIIRYRIVVKNEGNVDLTNVSVNDTLTTLTGPGGDEADPGVLNVGEVWKFYGNYTVTQEDLNNNGGGDGDIDNTAGVSCSELPDKTASISQPISQNAYLRIYKSAIGVDNAGDCIANKAGDIIEYQIAVKNDGKIDLTGVSVIDPLISLKGPVESKSADGVLRVGELWAYTGNYTVTQADIDSNGGGDGDIDNTATVICSELPNATSSIGVPLVITRTDGKDTGSESNNTTTDNGNSVNPGTNTDNDPGISGGSSHSSSGSGGASVSPESSKNIEVKEISQAFVTSGNSVKFNFPKNATSVTHITFDAKKTVGKTTTITEQLKNKSSLVSSMPEGDVYKYFNVWVGNSGFANSKNIENAVIYFRVEKAWMKEKGIESSSIFLNRYSDEKWNELPTSLSGEDGKYLYFTAKSPGFSVFAITAKTAAEGSDIEVHPKYDTDDVDKTGDETSKPQANEETSGKNASKFGLISLVVFLLMAGLAVVFLYKRRQEEQK